MATTKEITVGEREQAVGELLLREPEIIAWLGADDNNVRSDSSAMDELTETSKRGKKEDT